MCRHVRANSLASAGRPQCDKQHLDFYETFGKFLQQDEDAPDSLKELSEKALIKLVITDRILCFSNVIISVVFRSDFGRRGRRRKTGRVKHFPVPIPTVPDLFDGELLSMWLAVQMKR